MVITELQKHSYYSWIHLNHPHSGQQSHRVDLGRYSRRHHTGTVRLYNGHLVQKNLRTCMPQQDLRYIVPLSTCISPLHMNLFSFSKPILEWHRTINQEIIIGFFHLFKDIKILYSTLQVK